jgi:hypothetical protein
MLFQVEDKFGLLVGEISYLICRESTTFQLAKLVREIAPGFREKPVDSFKGIRPLSSAGMLRCFVNFINSPITGEAVRLWA